jgi:hypothetical protein
MNPDRTAKETLYFCIPKNNWLSLPKEIIAVYLRITQNTYTPAAVTDCSNGKNVDLPLGFKGNKKGYT